ncbi:hypothetical protein Godav_004247 [Gossypium davidsonii]|uniref:Uncharacterized protein n=2 Tax=Gossypium TaxID=3633 RepID=A0A7J8SKG3_GOSDV|nr:hypothetical protein [Gossypium davidsonii]MBA0662221.1 hypothetical protein [Gossypium klotzschianum]
MNLVLMKPLMLLLRLTVR